MNSGLGLSSPPPSTLFASGLPLSAQLLQSQKCVCLSVHLSVSLSQTQIPVTPRSARLTPCPAGILPLPGSAAASGTGRGHSLGLLLQVLQGRLQGVVGGRAGLQVGFDLCQLLFVRAEEFK